MGRQQSENAKPERRWARRALRLALRGLLPALVALGCGSDAHVDGAALEADAEPVQVELDVFSGRPNPIWELSDEQASEFTRLQASLDASDKTASVRDTLGYRGFRVRGVADFDVIAVFHDVVVTEREGQRQWLSDGGRRVEVFLLETARPHIDDALYDSLRQKAATR